MLLEKIINRQSGILTYGFTPPKESNTEEKIHEIARNQIERINAMDIDAVVLYDIQDEKERIADERPFPFLPTLDPEMYSRNYLSQIEKPKIIYRCVGKYEKDSFDQYLKNTEGQSIFNVFVGAASRQQQVGIRLTDAYEHYQQVPNGITLGGVAIPERHLSGGDEHIRLVHKAEKGCQFFVSQAVYNADASRNLLSEYYHYCKENGLETKPIIFTIAPCGSAKTLEFMKWLGISVPRWLENDLLHSENILDHSIRSCLDIFESLYQYGTEKNIPVGFNIESLSIRKAEIEASVELIKEIKKRLGK